MLRAGDMLFSVPKRLNVGLDTALADADCGDDFQSEAEAGGAMAVLCTFLAKLHLAGG